MQLLKGIAAAALVATVTLASAADGLIAVKSPVDAKTTMDRVEAQAKQRGLAIFARIDLPLKALVWQDAAGQVWLGYTYLAQRHA